MALKPMEQLGETTLITWKRQVKVEELHRRTNNLRIPKAISGLAYGEEVVLEPGEMLFKTQTQIGTGLLAKKQKENAGEDMQDGGDQQ